MVDDVLHRPRPVCRSGSATKAIRGIGTSGFSKSSDTGGRRLGLSAASGTGFGASDAASISGGLAGSALDDGSLIGCTTAVAAEGPEGSMAAGVARGGAASAFAVGEPIGPVIRQTTG